MKLYSFLQDGENLIGLEVDGETRILRGYSDMTELIRGMVTLSAVDREAFLLSLAGEALDVSALEPLAPIVVPAKDIICVGLNYQAHVNESQSMGVHENKADIHTTYFGKRCDWIRGNHEKVVIHASVDPELDYETELAVIIGQGGRAIAREDALRHVFGYSVGNDFSSRTLQRNHKQWYLGKGLDGYTAMGPCILVNADDVHHDFQLTGRVNGEVRQSSSTALMIKSVEDIIFEVSQAISLIPGDIIFTGTPAGVGAGFTPPNYLKAGDVVELEISGIGTLTNPIAAS